MSQDNFQDDEKQYEDVIAQLKSLEKISAPPGFEANLMRRINQEKFAIKEKDSFWKKFFTLRYLVPSTAGVTIVAIVVMLLINQSKVEENKTVQDSEIFKKPQEITSGQEDVLQNAGDVKKESVPQKTNKMPVAEESAIQKRESKEKKINLDDSKAIRTGAAPQLQKSEETETIKMDFSSVPDSSDSVAKKIDKKSILKKDTINNSGKGKK